MTLATSTAIDYAKGQGAINGATSESATWRHGPRLSTHVGPGIRLTLGFTLIEMLVVIGIILTLATLTVAFLPKITNYQKVQQGAGQVQGWLLTAKQRATRDHYPRGIRLVVPATSDPLYGNVVRDLQYVEQPDDFTGGVLTVNGIITGADERCANRDYFA